MRISTLLLTSIHMTLLGALLALSPRPLYGTGEVICFGTVLDAGQDQQLGGVVMPFVGAVVYLVGGLNRVSLLLSLPEEREQISRIEFQSSDGFSDRYNQRALVSVVAGPATTLQHAGPPQSTLLHDTILLNR